MKIAAPSPKGTNHARLFIERFAGAGLAFDSAPKRLGPRMRDGLVRAMCRAGCSDEDIDRILALCDAGDPAEDELGLGERYEGENVRLEATSKDGLPNYKPSGMPRNALGTDSRSVRDDLTRLMGHTKIGPI
jgi:hypothetical protein